MATGFIIGNEVISNQINMQTKETTGTISTITPELYLGRPISTMFQLYFIFHIHDDPVILYYQVLSHFS